LRRSSRSFSCGARAAGPPSSQTEFVRLIDDVVCGLGESFLGVIGDDPTSKAAREAKIISRPILSASRLLSRDSVSRMTLASPNSVGTDTLQCESVRDTFVDDPTQPLGQRDAGIAGGQWRQARQPLRDLAGARQ
jgi:hypothetical protein